MTSGAPPEPLGVVAGGGDLPLRVAEAALATGRPVHVILLDGFAEPRLWRAHAARCATFRLGATGTAVLWMRARGVRDLVMAGRVARPSILALRPDAPTAKLLARIGRRAFGGDDGLLSALREVLREEGFRLVGPDALLAGLQAPPGLLTPGLAPDALAMSDVARGVAVLRALGVADVGQAVVVQTGLVLAVEAIEGTDAMLARAGSLRREGAPGGVLVKLAKPGQDRSLDMPALGPATVAGAAAAGLRGVAFEAGSALVLDREATAREATARGLFLLAVRPDDHMPPAAANPGGTTR